MPAFIGPIWYLAVRGGGHSFLGAVAGAALFALILTCACTDVRSRKIPNWATYTAFLWALAINITASMTNQVVEEEALAHSIYGFASIGPVGAGQCLLGAAACFFIMLVIYSLARGGAGDVKLAAAIGSLVGVRAGLLVLVLTYIVAGVAILAWTIWAHGPIFLIKAFARQVGSILFPIWIAAPDEQQQNLLRTPAPLGAYFAIATCLAVFGMRNI